MPQTSTFLGRNRYVDMTSGYNSLCFLHVLSFFYPIILPSFRHTQPAASVRIGFHQIASRKSLHICTDTDKVRRVRHLSLAVPDSRDFPPLPHTHLPLLLALPSHLLSLPLTYLPPPPRPPCASPIPPQISLHAQGQAARACGA